MNSLTEQVCKWKTTTSRFLYLLTLTSLGLFSFHAKANDWKDANLEIELPPNISLDVQPNSFINCGAFTANVTVVSAEATVTYQLLFNGNPTGSSAVGTGANLMLTSASLNSNGTISVRATDTLGNVSTLTETVPVTVYQNPSTSNAGPNRLNCGLSIAMNATAPTIGVGTWSQVSGPGTAVFANVNARNSLVTVPVPGTYVFAWTITNGTCPPSVDDVQLQFFSPPTIANAGPDQLVCGLNTDLAGNTPLVGTGAWFFLSGPGGMSFSSTSDPNASVNVFAAGTYSVQWIIFNGACALSTDVVELTFTDQEVIADAGSNTTVCALATTINGNDPTPFTGVWTQTGGPGVATFTDATSSTTDVSVSVGGVYTFQWAIDNSPCPVSTSEVEINFNLFPEVCDGVDNDCDTQIDEGFDNDNDTYTVCENDCDDNDPTINPGVAEICDGIDNNCNTQIDEGVQTTYYQDADGDTYGNPAVTVLACSAPVGFVLDNTDCDDTNASINPSATEICDGLDNNCNVTIDEGVLLTFYADTDGDTYGDPANTTQACSAPAGYVTDNTDCDDTDATINSGSVEVCDGVDNNCNTTIDEGVQLTFYADTDGDTFGDPGNTTLACTAPIGFVSNNGDCDDTDPTIYNGAAEVCDGADNDCDTQIDEGVLNTYYIDADGDTYGNPLITTQACSVPVGYVTNNTDCNDANAAIFPSAAEICNGIDDDCDLAIDEGLVFITYYADNDGDTYGNPASTITSCVPVVGYVTNNTDCNDADATINPAASEICDGLDNNCNTLIDDGVGNTYYADADGDSFGNPAVTQVSCTQPVGYVTDNTDCDDTNAAINSAATEVCDGTDNNCNLAIDEGVQTTYYQDADGDGFGNVAVTQLACSAPVGYVSNSTDCNDTNAAINPSATEICDGLDNNCNVTIDEGVLLTFYADNDGDNFGDPANTTQACSAPVGYVTDNTDCDDTDATINGGSPEVCDGADNNCNTLIDEGVLSTFYADTDGDTFGDPNNTTQACSAPVGFVSDNTDCDDTNAAINSNAIETCDGIDNNCDTQIDEGLLTTYYADNDGDNFGDLNNPLDACTQPTGYVLDNTDCDDTNPAINFASPEVCDGIDNNCDTQIDEGVTNTYYADNDGDGYGDINNFQNACTAPVGYVTDSSDCDDTNAAINPGAVEVCDLIDNNCDFQIDENLGTVTYYMDNDGDGFGDANNSIDACVAPVGYVIDGTDCNDGEATVYPGAIELCDGLDNDCNTIIDDGLPQQTFYADSDTDGFGDASSPISACAAPQGYVSDNTDCNDADDTIYPTAVEICDYQDNDCDLLIDEGVLTTFYADNDGDGYGDNNNTVDDCFAPTGYVADNTDCDDNDATINPGVAEVCDGSDNNCNTQIDEGVLITYYADADGDTFGDPNNSTQACSSPLGFVTDNTDCDDTDASINVNGTESCDGVDNNCNTQIDEGLLTTYFADNDGDNFGDPNNTLDACTQPIGYVIDNTDCDDTNPAINFASPEICDGIDNNCDTNIDEGVTNTYYADADGDGFGDINVFQNACTQPVGYVTDQTDCDDTDAAINPAATDVCDGLDNNCDFNIDENGGVNTYYADTDGDGFGDPNNSTLSCTVPVGFVTDNTDCDDTNNTIYPGATEFCDGIDTDCDLILDNGFTGILYYADTDNDTYGDPNNTITSCILVAGYVTNNLDCDDTNAAVNPAATEVCDGFDNDCDTQIDEGFTQNTYYADNDGDGFGDANMSVTACSPPSGYVVTNTDCDDTNNNVFPGAPEQCDGLDNDCDTQIDEGLTGTPFYADTDGDGFGDASNFVTACVPPTGYVADNTDCDDTNNTIYPGATELCDALDNDCDFVIDNGLTLTTYYLDFDGDGFGDLGATQDACVQPTGYVTDNTDCDDNNAASFPGNPEVCDGIDNDCDFVIDNGFTLTVYYADLDGDGFGDPNNTIDACAAPSGYVTDFTDCDDTNADIYPGAAELCDGLDNDCDEVIDNGLPGSTYYADLDGDGFGDPNNSVDACVQPTGYVTDNTDCDDANAASFPGNPEICDGIDNDCDFVIDNGFTLTTFFADLDGDGFGDPNNTLDACAAPTGYVSDNTDCDDANAASFPGNPEVCDGIDNDCDFVIDNGFTLTPFYADLDGDGYGDPNNTVDACAAPSGYVSDNTDCDDTQNTIYPGAVELCDGFDNNCDTQIDEGLTLTTYYADLDGDGYGDPNQAEDACSQPTGYVTDNTDCDDTNAAIFPGNPEVCDGLDNNCDTAIDEGLALTTYYADLDGDGFGDPNNSVEACSQPTGYVSDNTDCDDSNGSVYPGAEEVCDSIDNDCDTEIDEGLTAGGCVDTDGDTVRDSEDIDDDNDGILDATELSTALNNGDTDGDGIPDIIDLDSDNDGIADVIEAGGTDPDSDGVIGTGPITDVNGDGLADVVEPNGLNPADTDADGLPDFQDIESDGDGINDSDEIDTDGDAIGPDDTDGDGVPDYQDPDDDGDGLLTSVEYDFDGDGNGPDDCDYDGLPNYLDADQCELFFPEGFSPNGDGINDTYIIEGVQGGTEVSFEVFNRWGAVVYTANPYTNDWDGTSNTGSSTGDLPVGTYYYIVKIGTEERVGYLTLWR